MGRFKDFEHMALGFWAAALYISATLGDSKDGRAGAFSMQAIETSLAKNGLLAGHCQLSAVKQYPDLRAALLNNRIEPALMDAASASPTVLMRA